MLTEEQIEQFKAEGYVILRDFYEPQQIGAWRDKFWSHVEAKPDKPQTWPDDIYAITGLSLEPVASSLPQSKAVIEQLGGKKFTGGGGPMLVKWPNPKQEWQLPAIGHIDDYGPGGWSGAFMLGATSYLENVEAQGGAFVYWPQSHLSTHEYFLEFPEQIDGSFRQGNDWEGRLWGLFSNLSPQGPREFIGHAGDIIFWHGFLCHAGSANVNSRPRQGMFARWHHADRKEIRHDVPENLWKYWNI